MKKLVKILVVSDGEVLVVQQFRKQINKTTIELPGGNIESEESPLEAAKRELREETGITSNELINLGSYVNSIGSIQVNLFFTNQIESTEKQSLDIVEAINVQFHPIPIVLDNIFSGKWDDIRLGMAFLIARGMGLIL